VVTSTVSRQAWREDEEEGREEEEEEGRQEGRMCSVPSGLGARQRVHLGLDA
jgi:predicted transposase YdaD